MFNDIGVDVKIESNLKDSTVTNVPNVGKDMSDKKLDSRNSNPEASEQILSNGASTVDKQAMVSPVEGERLQYRSGGCRVDSQVMAVITSILILVLIRRE